jgi:hypothetical protein
MDALIRNPHRVQQTPPKRVDPTPKSHPTWVATHTKLRDNPSSQPYVSQFHISYILVVWVIRWIRT